MMAPHYLLPIKMNPFLRAPMSLLVTEGRATNSNQLCSQMLPLVPPTENSISVKKGGICLKNVKIILVLGY